MQQSPDDTLSDETTDNPTIPGVTTPDPADAPTFSPSGTNRKFSWKKITPILTMILLLGGVMVGIAATKTSQENRSRATVTGSTLAIEPSTKTATAGTTFTLGITLNTNDDQVSAAELHLAYDPAAIQITDFTVGTILPLVLVPKNIANGSVSITLGAQPTSPFKGAGIVGTITVKALTSTTSTITFTGDTTVAALYKPTNSLVEKTGATITDGGPTPTSGGLLYIIENSMCKIVTTVPTDKTSYPSLSACVGGLNDLMFPSPTATPSATPKPSNPDKGELQREKRHEAKQGQ